MNEDGVASDDDKTEVQDKTKELYR